MQPGIGKTMTNLLRRGANPDPRVGVAVALLAGAALFGWPVAAATQAQPAVDWVAGGRIIVRADPRSQPSLVRAAASLKPFDAPHLSTIGVTYTGFTPEAQAAFQYAVNIWAAQLTSPVAIQIDAEFTALGPGVLGSAGPYLVRNATGLMPNTWYPVPMANRIAGRDLLTSQPDINASFSNSFNWYYGTDGHAPSGTYDFVSVVLHELGHGMGVLGLMNYTAGVGTWGSGGFPSIWDRFSVNGSGQLLISAFPNSSTALGAQLISNNLYLDGPQTRLANGGQPARLYAPATWREGSSYSHLDEATYGVGNPNSLMTPSISSREAIHDPGPIVRGMLSDMGWTVVSQTPPNAPAGFRIIR